MASSEPTLSPDEREGIITAVRSVFFKLKKLYQEITPTIQKYGFTVPSAGVIARDLSEKIEEAIVQHCSSFSKGPGHTDLSRSGREWEVKICKDSGLTINQSKVINGENYIVVNYKANSQVTKIWVLWNARDSFFSPRKPNTNARSLLTGTATESVEILFKNADEKPAMPTVAQRAPLKATLAPKVKAKKNTA